MAVYLIGRRIDTDDLPLFLPIDIEFSVITGDRSLELAASVDGCNSGILIWDR